LTSEETPAPEVTPSEVVSTEEAVSEEPAVETPAEEVPAEVSETETPASAEVKPEPEPQPDVMPEPTTTESVDWQKRAEAVEAQLSALSQRVLEQARSQAPAVEPRKEPEAVKPPVAPAAPTPTPTPDVLPFVSEEEFGKALESPQALNTLLNKVHNQSVQSYMRAMPGLVNRQVAQASMLTRMRDAFYEANKDLKPYQDFVALVTSEIHAKNPEMRWDKLFEEAATETRKRLPHLVKTQPQTPSEKPSTATKPPGTRKPTAKKSPEEKELADLLFD